MLELSIEPAYAVHEVREIDAPNFNIWPLQTMSFPCSKDGKGRARLVLVDIINEEIIGIYHGGGRRDTYMVTPLAEQVRKVLYGAIPWHQYKEQIIQ